MNDFPRTLKFITIWLGVGAAILLAVLWYESAQNKANFSISGNVIEIRRSQDGHYHWQGEVNGQKVNFLIDTGASITSIPNRTAEKAQLPTQSYATFATANGTTRNRIVRATLTLEGGIRINNLRMGVLPANSDEALLGMDVIGKLHMTQSGNAIRFERP